MFCFIFKINILKVKYIKNIDKRNKPYQKNIYAVILVLTILWCIGIIAAPLWSGENGVRGDISKGLYVFYAESCHQMEDRSFTIAGNVFGVCSRCSFIYLGFLIGAILYPFLWGLYKLDLPPVWILLVAAFFVALDVGLDILGIVKNTFVTREVTGIIIGIILPFFIIPGFIRIYHEFKFSQPVSQDKTN